MTDNEKVIAIIRSMNDCKSSGIICNDCPLKSECYNDTKKTVGEIAVKYLQDRGQIKVCSDGSRSRKSVDVYLHGNLYSRCKSIIEAQSKTGKSISTIKKYSKKGLQTVDGYRFIIKEKKHASTKES